MHIPPAPNLSPSSFTSGDIPYAGNLDIAGDEDVGGEDEENESEDDLISEVTSEGEEMEDSEENEDISIQRHRIDVYLGEEGVVPSDNIDQDILDFDEPGTCSSVFSLGS